MPAAQSMNVDETIDLYCSCACTEMHSCTYGSNTVVTIQISVHYSEHIVHVQYKPHEVRLRPARARWHSPGVRFAREWSSTHYGSRKSFKICVYHLHNTPPTFFSNDYRSFEYS